jgi:hypothetical protein
MMVRIVMARIMAEHVAKLAKIVPCAAKLAKRVRWVKIVVSLMKSVVTPHRITKLVFFQSGGVKSAWCCTAADIILARAGSGFPHWVTALSPQLGFGRAAFLSVRVPGPIRVFLTVLGFASLKLGLCSGIEVTALRFLRRRFLFFGFRFSYNQVSTVPGYRVSNLN